MDFMANKTSLLSAANIARSHAQYPLELVEEYMEAAKTGIQGLDKLDQILAHIRRQSQVCIVLTNAGLPCTAVHLVFTLSTF